MEISQGSCEKFEIKSEVLMIGEEVKKELKNIVNGELLFDEPLSRHSTLKVGGRSGAFIAPASREELVKILQLTKERGIEVFVMGGGSNILFRDSGFEGVVLSTVKLRNLKILESGDFGLRVLAEAGLPIGEAVSLSAKEGVSGFENLFGIPGTVGGAISMNAGTVGGAISDSLVSVEAVDKTGRLYNWPKNKIEFSYRKAKFPKSCAIIAGEFLLQKGIKEEIEKTISEIKERRKETQPLKWPSLGSIFKNPEKGPSAGKLVQEAGLRGVRVGGARISHEHGNWIINEAGASSKDVEVLIHLAREKVKETADISLETEIIIVGNRS